MPVSNNLSRTFEKAKLDDNVLFLSVIPSALILLLVNSVAAIVFYKCRLMIPQVRVILLFGTIHVLLTTCIISLLQLLTEAQRDHVCLYGYIFKSHIEQYPVTLNTYLAVDRMLSIHVPYWYARTISSKHTIAICSSLSIMLYVTVFFFYEIVPNDTVPNGTVPNDTVLNGTVPNDQTSHLGCSSLMELTQSGLILEICMYTICFLVAWCAYAILFYHSKKYASSIQPAESVRSALPTLKSTFRVSFLIGGVTVATFVCYLVLLVLDIIVMFAHEKTEKEMRVSKHVFISWNVCVPFIYITRFRECRIIVMKMFCKFNSKLSKKVVELETKFRLEHAGIPLNAASSIGHD